MAIPDINALTSNSDNTYGYQGKTVAQNPSGTTNQTIKTNQPYILDLVTRERLVFQNVPLELSYDPDSRWLAVASPGRNNPIYHYLGSEDTLSFTLSWYSDDSTKQDVITKIKWLESLSKNNGYTEKPHMLQCVWGDLFRDAKWIMFKAGPARLSLFDRTAGMMPKLASQDIVLKRVVEQNRTRTNILDIYQ